MSTLIHGMTGIFGGLTPTAAAEDISTKLSLEATLADVTTISGARGMDVRGDVCAVISETNNRIVILDLTDETNPVVAGFAAIGGQSKQVAIKNQFVYTTSVGLNRLQIIDIARATPVVVKNIESIVDPLSIRIFGDFLYCASPNILIIFDISNPEETYEIGRTIVESTTLSGVNEFIVKDDLAYCMATNSNRFTVVDIADKRNPAVIASIVDAVALNSMTNLQVRDNFVVCISPTQNRITTINIVDCLFPVVADTLQDNVNLVEPFGLELFGDKVITCNKSSNTVAVFDISDLNAITFQTKIVDNVKLVGASDLKLFRGTTVAVATSTGLTLVNLNGGIRDTAKFKSLHADVLHANKIVEAGNVKVNGNGYAEMFVSLNSAPTVIIQTNIFQFATFPGAGLIQHLNFIVGLIDSITAYAMSGGNTLVTSNSHGLSNDDIISISGTNAYNGIFIISGVTTNTYIISTAFVTDEATGTWHRGSGFKALDGAAGIYSLRAHFTDTTASANQTIRVELFINGITEPKFRLGRTFSSNDIGVGSATALIKIKKDDVIQVAFKNETSTSDITIIDGNMNMSWIAN